MYIGPTLIVKFKEEDVTINRTMLACEYCNNEFSYGINYNYCPVCGRELFEKNVARDFFDWDSIVDLKFPELFDKFYAAEQKDNKYYLVAEQTYADNFELDLKFLDCGIYDLELNVVQYILAFQKAFANEIDIIEKAGGECTVKFLFIE